MRYLYVVIISLIGALVLTACGSAVPVIKPYKLEIQQGNVVTSKMLLQLKPGMTKSQVRYIMGTPLIVDSFHKDRWDYFYQMRQGGKVVEQRRVILDFEKDALVRVHGDVVPQGTEGAVTGEPQVSHKTADMVKERDEPGLLEKLQFWKKNNKPADAAPAVIDTPKSEPAKSPDKTPDKASAVTTPEEKSWLDKLQFWKSREPAAAAEAKAVAKTPLEAPKETIQATPAATADTPAEDTPSILAVPTGVESFTRDQEVETTPLKNADVAQPKVKEPESLQAVATPPEPAPAPLPEPSPSRLKPTTPEPKSEPKPEPAPAPAPQAATKTESAKVAMPTPSKPAPLKSMRPVMVPPAKQDEKKVFRMDKTLDAKALEQETNPIAPVQVTESAPAVEQKPAPISKPVKKTEEPPLPEASEPSFFDKMLEKIGF